MCLFEVIVHRRVSNTDKGLRKDFLENVTLELILKDEQLAKELRVLQG